MSSEKANHPNSKYPFFLKLIAKFRAHTMYQELSRNEITQIFSPYGSFTTEEMKAVLFSWVLYDIKHPSYYSNNGAEGLVDIALSNYNLDESFGKKLRSMIDDFENNMPRRFHS